MLQLGPAECVSVFLCFRPAEPAVFLCFRVAGLERGNTAVFPRFRVVGLRNFVRCAHANRTRSTITPIQAARAQFLSLSLVSAWILWLFVISDPAPA